MRFVCDSCRAQYMISDDKVGAKGVKVRCKKCGYVILVRRADAAGPSPVAAAPASSPAPSNGPAADAAPPPESSDSSGTSEASDSSARSDASAGADASSGDGASMSNGATDSEAPAPSAPQSSPFSNDPNAPFSGVQDDEIGAVFDQVLKSGPHKIDEKPINSLAPPPEHEDLNLGMDDDLASTRVVSTDALKKLAEEAEAQAAGANGKKKSIPNDWYVAVDDAQQGPLTLEKVKDLWDRGEIGPDSLCWRAGMADWVPLSEVTDLASELAPKPAKPVVAPAATSQVGTVLSVPMETSINVGGVSRTVRTETPMAAFGSSAGHSMAASAGESAVVDSGGWKPSAASALAALVSEEMSALSSKPKPRSLLETGPNDMPHAAATPVAKSSGGLLDIPSAPHDIAPTNGTATSHAEALSRGPNAPYAGPATYGQSSYPAYTPAPPAAHGMSPMVKIGLGVAALVVLILGGVIVFLVTRSPAPVAAPVQVAQATPPAAKPLEMPPPPAGMTAKPAEQSATATPPVATATPTTPPVVAEAAKPPPTPVTAEPRVDQKPPPQVAAVQPASGTTRRSRSGTTQQNSAAEEDTGEIVAPTKKTGGKKVGDAFDDLFADDDEKPAAEAPKKRPSGGGYIPPAPGAGDPNAKESLSQSDVMSVVLAHKADIVKCVSEQKAKDPGASGKLVMRWTILTSGKTTGVSVQSAQFKSTYMASCMTGLVKSWRFPVHRTQGDPIDFPFTF